MEDTFKKLNLDAVVSAEEVDSLLKANQINTQTAEYLKHTITRRKEAKSMSSTPTAIYLFIEAGNYWRNLFLFIGVPSIALVAVNTYYLEKEHEKHLEEHAPEQIPYEHMRIRTKVQSSQQHVAAH